MKVRDYVKTAVREAKRPFPMFCIGAFIALLFVSLISNTQALLTPEDARFEVPASSDRDKASPTDYVSESQIHVYKDRIVIDASDVKWAAFEDTKSMLPVINKDSNALQIVPQCPEQIDVGDIVSYKSEYASGIIIHRVIYASKDEDGPYFILKGDNNPSSDPGKIRCDQIQRKLIAVIY